MGIPLNVDWQQILLHLFNFIILFGGLWLLLYKPVKNFMAKREAYYRIWTRLPPRSSQPLKTSSRSTPDLSGRLRTKPQS